MQFLMKQLIVIRHAKSDWGSGATTDFDRPLNDRGHKEAPAMAERLLAKGIHIDAFVTSTANRAKTTAAYFIKAFGKKEKELVLVPELYHAHSEVFYACIQLLPDALETVVIFSHNPGITDFVNSLGIAALDNMPTCGIFGVVAQTASWKDFEKAEKSFLLFDYPKLTA
jgi:phosphohistidine phosphatase